MKMKLQGIFLLLAVLAVLAPVPSLSVEPDDKAAYQLLLEARGLRADDPQQAARIIELCTQALAMDPTLLAAYKMRAYVLDKRGDSSRALEDLTEVSRRDAFDIEAPIMRGWVRMSRWEYYDAQQDFERAAHLDPENPDALYGCGSVALKAGQRDQGIVYLKKAADRGSYLALTALRELGEPYTPR